MKKKIAILGSTGSIGENTLKIIKNDKKNFDIVLLSTNKNINKILKQAKEFNVKNIIISDLNSYRNALIKFKKSNINFYNNYDHLNKIMKTKSDIIIQAKIIARLTRLIPNTPSLKTLSICR